MRDKPSHAPANGHCSAPNGLFRPRPCEMMQAPSHLDKALRVIWSVTWFFLYKPTPIPFHAWRCFILRLFGAKIAPGALPYPSVRIWRPWNLTIEEGGCIASNVDCYSVAPIFVGRNATISQKSYLCTASHDFRDAAFPLIAAPIRVEEGAWVAAGAFIGPGVIVEKRAVVGACAVVTRSVASEFVVAGNPAIVVSSRNASRVVAE